MKNVSAYIKGLIATTAIITAVVSAIPAFAAHSDELHEATYYGVPGEVLRGQVTIMNPSDETKVVEVTVESPHDIEDEWLFLDQSRYTIGPLGKAVISYRVVIPPTAKEDCVHYLKIREVAPKNTLSLTQAVSINITRPAAQTDGSVEINLFYTAFFIMLVVAFGIGLSICAVVCVKKIPALWNGDHKKKARKKRK